MDEMIWAFLTKKEDQTPHTCKLKVYWKTTKQWTDSDIRAYQAQVPQLAQNLKASGRKFTCEDFALELLCDFASSRGLPVKLMDGVGTYRNMDIYDPSCHEGHPQTPRGFIDMVMITFGAPDIQRGGQNTVRLAGPENLLPGDILAIAHDLKGQSLGGVAHHIQVVTRKTGTSIDIYQGNSNSDIHWPLTWTNRVLGRNPADPTQAAYAGTTVETGVYTLAGSGWNYRNNDTGQTHTDYLKVCELYRWNFREFNR